MKKIYKTDIGTLVYAGIGIPFFLVGTYLALFLFNDSPIWIKIASPMISLFSIFYFINLLSYKLELEDETLHSKILLLSFLSKYKTMKFEEVGEVFNTFSIFPEMQIIFFKSRNNPKKLISIIVGFGLPWDALLDILDRLPKDVKINFDTELWNRIKKPLLNKRVRRINIIVIIVILMIIFWFCYFLFRKLGDVSIY